MLANFLNKSKPINFVGLLVFFVAAFLFAFFSEGYTTDKLLKSSILLVLFIVIFFIFNFINSKNKLTLDNSYAYFTLILLTICISSSLSNYQIFYKTILYFLFLRKIYSLRSSKNTIEKYFDSGFWLGILFILEPFSILFFILIYAACYLHNKINIHAVGVPILGFSTPLILFFTYHFWYETTTEFTKLFAFNTNFSLQFYFSTKYLWFLAGVFLFTVFAMFFKSMKALSVNNTFKKSWILIMLNFLIALVFSLSFTEKDGSELIFLLFPASIIIANGIELIHKKILKNVLLYLLLAASIVLHFVL